jgi:RNA polymerase sigma factor (sigma-70 family)
LSLLSERRSGATDFHVVYDQERPAIVRLAFLLVRSQAVAEELSQEAFIRLYANFGETDNPAAFLRTAVTRLASTWRSRRDMEVDRLALVCQPPTSRLAEPDETWEVIGRLRPERATVLVLRFYQDLSHKEIAETLGCPVATVRSRLRRALDDLRKELHSNDQTH